MSYCSQVFRIKDLFMLIMKWKREFEYCDNCRWANEYKVYIRKYNLIFYEYNKFSIAQPFEFSYREFNLKLFMDMLLHRTMKIHKGMEIDINAYMVNLSDKTFTMEFIVRRNKPIEKEKVDELDGWMIIRNKLLYIYEY